MPPVKLSKCVPRRDRSNNREWQSAQWCILEAPGLRLAVWNQTDLEGKKITGWRFKLPGYLMQDEHRSPFFDYSLTLAAWPHLEGQVFLTRREALQALEAIKLMEED